MQVEKSGWWDRAGAANISIPVFERPRTVPPWAHMPWLRDLARPVVFGVAAQRRLAPCFPFGWLLARLLFGRVGKESGAVRRVLRPRVSQNGAAQIGQRPSWPAASALAV